MGIHLADVTRLSAAACAHLAAFGRHVHVKRGASISAHEGVVALGDIAVSVSREGKPGLDLGFLGPGGLLGAERLFLDYPPVAGRALRDGDIWYVSLEASQRAIVERQGLRAALMQIAMASCADHFRRAAGIVEKRADKRVAQWLFECANMLETSELKITHEEIADALGVRRSSVTDSLHMIEGVRVIRSERGRLTILDPTGLAHYAGLDVAHERAGSPRHAAERAALAAL
jgi:CRP-like cAMP-binding protein